eukprot:COSAG01_NODE_18533_length_1069_cov_10.684536_2_plen_89_part_00
MTLLQAHHHTDGHPVSWRVTFAHNHHLSHQRQQSATGPSQTKYVREGKQLDTSRTWLGAAAWTTLGRTGTACRHGGVNTKTQRRWTQG